MNYIGSIHPDNVPLQTIDCDAVIMALDPSNDNNRMSAPNKLFEAMSAGVPIITCKELLMGQFVKNEEMVDLVNKYTEVEEKSSDPRWDALKDLKINYLNCLIVYAASLEFPSGVKWPSSFK